MSEKDTLRHSDDSNNKNAQVGPAPAQLAGAGVPNPVVAPEPPVKKGFFGRRKKDEKVVDDNSSADATTVDIAEKAKAEEVVPVPFLSMFKYALTFSLFRAKPNPPPFFITGFLPSLSFSSTSSG
jgi:hypothetical protein